MLEKIEETVRFLQEKGMANPVAGVVLGSGLGGLAAKVEDAFEIDYKDIPNFPVSTVEGHDGKLICGNIGSRKVVVMKGRFHFYEGYGSDMVAFPIRVLKYLGVKMLFLSNASGGVNPTFNIGDVMIIKDHINLLPNPLIGPNDSRIGPRFPDMSEAYDKQLIDMALNVAAENHINVAQGVYLATSGPTYETPSEYKYFRTIGADAVGMSTTQEVIVAHHAALPVFAISIITDLGVEGKIEFMTHEAVIKEAAKAEKNMTTIIVDMIKRI